MAKYHVYYLAIFKKITFSFIDGWGKKDMALFTIHIGTSQPIPFKEYCSDVEFYANVRGSADIAFYNEACYGVGKEGEDTLRTLILGTIPSCFKFWPEGKLVMGPGNREILDEIGNGFQGMFALHSISPQSPKETWTCQSCGTEGNISKFCPNCGKPRPI